MTDRYIKHPLEAVSVGDVVDVEDLKRRYGQEEDRSYNEGSKGW